MQLENLKTTFLGRNWIHVQVIDSTQLEIWRQIENGKIENGTLVLADIQTNGKRNSRKKMVYR